MKRLIVATLIGAAAICFALPGLAQSEKTDVTVPVGIDALMQQKLMSAQALLKGLALDDFKLIQRESQRLQLLSLDAGWNTVQTADYARIAVEFREAAKKIRRAAEEKYLDAAGLGYFQLTMTCIDCHRHVRIIEGARK